MELPENERPERWEGRLTLVVLPENPDDLEANPRTPGSNITCRNAVTRSGSFCLRRHPGNIYFNRDLIVYARAVYLANQWMDTDAAYRPLHHTYQISHLRPPLNDLFDTFAILDIWNFAQPDQCHFLIEKHNAIGDKIPKAIQTKKSKMNYSFRKTSRRSPWRTLSASSSLAKFIGELQEPTIDGKHCIPWLGEVATKEKVLRLCAAGKLAINLRGLELLQAQPGELKMRRGCASRASSVPARSLSKPSFDAWCNPQSGGTLPLP